jgi:tRNA pseudouridine65 synthase
VLQILHDDAQLVAVNKPAGIAMHRSQMAAREDAYLVDAVREQTGRTLYLAHRLDRATSGVVLLGADKETVAALGAQFMGRAVEKVYLAVARGHVDESGTIDHPLDAPGQREEKRAVTHYRRLATIELPIPVGRYESVRYSLVEVRPETGRYRQIRRHFKHLSHHLIGDTSHGEGRHNRLFRARFGVHRLLLHAWRLELAHPATGAPLRIAAPLDAQWEKLLRAFDWLQFLDA